MDNTSGRRWARTFLALALSISVVGNVAHTVLAESSISLWLRVPGAVIWPIFTFGGIEIVVHMVWERSFTHRLGRNIILLPAIPAAITSYQHLYSLLLMMGEERFIASIGPLAIDGMMVGCTMVLLFTRPQTPTADVEPALQRLEALALEQTSGDWDSAAERELSAIEPTSPAPIGQRTPRGEVSSALRTAVAELISGVPAVQVSTGQGASRSVIGRYHKVMRILRDDPNALIDVGQEKVRQELVDEIRAAMRQERVR